MGMSLSVEIGWNWTAFGILVAYQNDKVIYTKSVLINIGFLAIAFDWGY